MFSSYQLHRIPKEPSLSAWTAADELFSSRYKDVLGKKTLIVNDAFGALALQLNHRDNIWCNDSAMSLEALKINSSINEFELPRVVTTLENYDTDTDIEQVVIQLPKSVRFFEYQLSEILSIIKPDTKIYVLGMVKHISNGHIKIMNSMFNSSDPGKAEKKARVIELSLPKNTQAKSLTNQYQVPELDMRLTNQPGCFAENSIDPGARVLINHFNDLPEVETALDLGCGNGLLALALLKQQPNIEMHLVDDSFQAIASAEINLKTQGFNHAHYWHNNSLNGLETIGKVDLVLCNPPFHQQTTLTERIAQELLRDSCYQLNDGGELWIVANRHLNYKPLLKRLFNRVVTISKDSKFNVIRCTK